MKKGTDGRISRRRALQGLGASAAFTLAGCMGGNGNGTTATGSTDGIPSKEQGVEEWKQRLNDHAREADIEWDMFADQDITLTFGMGLHPYSTTTGEVKEAFTELTGIEVEYKTFAEDQFWLQAESFVSDQTGAIDGIMVGLWPAGGYHYGNGNGGWVRDLNQYINDPKLTDKDWLHMEDFRDDTIELMTFPNEDGSESFVGFPNGIEAYGCLAIDKPTFDQLGIKEPTTFDEMEAAAKQISESDEVDREGIVSRTSSTTLSSANWGTMFKTYGADWIDRQTKEAALNSEQGVKSLERFGRLINDYGPESPGTRDWYANNTAFSDGQVAMMYSTPQTSGIVSRDQINRTKFLPPMRGPQGQEPVVDTWIWSTGISKFSQNPEAAWLYIQWANSRAANYMLSTKQWREDDPRAGYARWNYVRDEVLEDDTTPDPPDGYLNAFEKGMNNVPTRPPPVPVDTPENMDIMSQAARAMSSVASGDRTAQDALDSVAPEVTQHAKEIPDRYVAYLNQS